VLRLRAASGPDGNPLNEVGLLRDAQMHHGGVLRAITAMKLVPKESKVKLQSGDTIVLPDDDSERLSKDVSAETEHKYV
jgi:hypothetical protein